jgi:hypothetical protein
LATAVIEYPGRSTTFDGFGAGHVVCADTEVTGTEIKTEATIKAATDTPQLLAFACVIVNSFPIRDHLCRLGYGAVACDRAMRRQPQTTMVVALPAKFAHHSWYERPATRRHHGLANDKRRIRGHVLLHLAAELGGFWGETGNVLGHRVFCALKLRATKRVGGDRWILSNRSVFKSARIRLRAGRSRSVPVPPGCCFALPSI